MNLVDEEYCGFFLGGSTLSDIQTLPYINANRKQDSVHVFIQNYSLRFTIDFYILPAELSKVDL